MTALSERAVACAGFRWMPGMLANHRHVQRVRVLCDDAGEGASDYVVRPGADGNEVQLMHEWGVMGSFPGGDGSAYPMLPDLDDPATLGCFEHGLLPAAWGGVPVDRESWLDGGGVKHYQVCVHLADGCRDFESTIGFGHCFVMALEAAPGPETP